eukprot:1153578-Pelagomonas_calceolata.AAC.1
MNAEYRRDEPSGLQDISIKAVEVPLTASIRSLHDIIKKMGVTKLYRLAFLKNPISNVQKARDTHSAKKKLAH